MSEAAHSDAGKAVVVEMLDAMSADDAHRLTKVFAFDARWWGPPSAVAQGMPSPIRGRDDIVGLVAQPYGFLRAGRRRWTVHHLIAEGDMVAVHANLEATTATGTPYSNSHCNDHHHNTWIDPMDIGIVTLPTDTSARLDDLAVAAEERGLTHLYAGGDHTHIPANRATPFPGGADLPDEYRHTYDPLIALAAAAARTSHIRLGTCIHLAAQRDPISTAKQVASLDALAPGRIDYGFGYGWNVEEAADHGVEWKTRRRRVDEYVAAMKTLWTEDEATFRGEFVSFERAWMWPKPATPPRVILGASPGTRTFGAIVDWADGWFPVPFWGHAPAQAEQLHQIAAERGRDPGEIGIVVDGVLVDPAMIDPWAESKTRIEAVLVAIPSLPLDEVLSQLDAAASLIDRYG